MYRAIATVMLHRMAVRPLTRRVLRVVWLLAMVQNLAEDETRVAPKVAADAFYLDPAAPWAAEVGADPMQ